MYNVKEIRKDFPMLKKRMQNHPLIFLDNASTTFKPNSVIDAINNILEEHDMHLKSYDFTDMDLSKIVESSSRLALYLEIGRTKDRLTKVPKRITAAIVFESILSAFFISTKAIITARAE